MNSKSKIIIGSLVVLFLVLLLCSLFSFFSAYKYYSFDESDLEFHVERLRQADRSRLSSENLEALEKIAYVPVDFDKIPKDCVNAFVSIEDKSFWSNNGIDTKGFIRLSMSVFSLGLIDAGGGSTISQQVIKLSRDEFYNRSIDDKYIEMLYAKRLNDILSKEEIFELYVNNAYFGDYNYGIQGASRSYFGKDVFELSLSECAYLAGMPKAPNTFSPTIGSISQGKKRQKEVLDEMVEEKYINEDESVSAYNDAIFY